MKFIFIVLLFDFVFQDSQCQKITSDVNISVMSNGVYNVSCKEIKCPIEEEPICVRLQYSSSNWPELGGKTVYVVTYNRCEMQYFNCNKGIKVVEMPMKNCEDSHGKNKQKKMPKHQLKRSFSNFKLVHKRHRRQVHTDSYDEMNQVITSAKIPKTKQRLPMYKKSKAILGPVLNDKKKSGGEKIILKKHPVKKMLKKGSFTKNRDPAQKGLRVKGKPLRNNTIIDAETIKRQEEIDTSTRMTIDESNGKSSLFEQFLIPMPGRDVDGAGDGGSKPGNQENRDSEDISHALDERDPPDALVAQGDIEDEEEDEQVTDTIAVPVDEEQYKADCPTACPTRDVMLCARCTHGVYRTFPSVCHMRIYACRQPEEGLELVSRELCIMSAPYLNDLREPNGTVAEHTDVDPVLQYINCREFDRTGSHRQRVRCLGPPSKLGRK